MLFLSHSVLKKPHPLKRQSLKRRPLVLSTVSVVTALTLSACTTYRDIPANAPLNDVMAIMGQPSHQCTLADGVTRYVWSTQPMGQYAYGANVGSDGQVIGRVESILSDAYFNRRFSEGGPNYWTRERVLCEFGAPAETEILGLGEKREHIWSYRYKQHNVWPSLMHVYMGPDGQGYTRHHTGPDPLYDRDYYEWGW